MERITELREWMNAFRSRLSELAEIEGDLDEAQRSEWDALNSGYDEMSAEFKPLEDRQKRIAAVAARAIMTSTGDGAAAAGAHRAEFQVNVRPSTDEIYDRSNLSVDNPANGGAFRDRALAAIDAWRSPAEWKESAQNLIDAAPDSKRDRQIADHILTYGHPLYSRAFNQYFAGGPNVLPMLDPEEQRYFATARQRAVNEGSVSAGQALVPPYLDPTIIFTNVGISNPFRQLCTVKTITTQTWKGVTSAGVTAEWTAEAAEVTDASPTFTQPSITPIRADAYIQASFETIEDTDLATDLAALFADARDRLEGAAFATGTGSTQPTGIVTALQLVTASRTAANTNGSIGYVDLLALDSNLPPRYRNDNTSWVMNKGIANNVRQLPLPTSVSFSPWVDFGGALPPKLIGYNLYQASAMQASLSAATASNDDVIVLGDFRSGMYIVDRVGMSVAFNPLVLGSNRRPTGESAWVAFWRVGSNVVSPSAFQMLRA